MIKTQVQIPEELFHRAKRFAAAKEWSFAELVRRGLEDMVSRRPKREPSPTGWQLPKAVDIQLTADPFVDPDWRERANVDQPS